MTFYPTDSDQPQFPTCPRHPDQVTYTRCGRCGRPTCTRCQVQLEVGMMCVDCWGKHLRNTPRTKTVPTSAIATYTLIGINVLIYLLQLLIPHYRVVTTFLYNPLYVENTGQWWRMLTAGFLHDQTNISHLLLNMFSLWIFGRTLEPIMGRWKYILVYLLSIIGGSVGVWIVGELTGQLAVNTIGASGGIFGLFGAFFVLTRLRGANANPILILIAINFIYGFITPGISWEAHLGGLLTGMMSTLIVQRLSNRGSAESL